MHGQMQDMCGNCICMNPIAVLKAWELTENYSQEICATTLDSFTDCHSESGKKGP